MARATLGEPMGGQHAVLLYSLQGDKGAPVLPATPIGIAPIRVTAQSGKRAIPVLGNHQVGFIRPGGAQYGFNFTNIQVQNKAFFVDCCQRVGQLLQWFTLGVGFVDDDDPAVKWAHAIQDCKVGQYDLSLQAGDGSGLLVAGFTGVGGLATEVNTLEAANAAEQPFAEFDAVVNLDGSPCECRSFQAAVNHHVAVRWVLRGEPPLMFKRGWAHQREGIEEVTGSVSRYAPSGLDFLGEESVSYPLALLLEDVAGSGNSMGITATDAEFTEESIEVDPGMESDLIFTNPFLAKGLVIS